MAILMSETKLIGILMIRVLFIWALAKSDT